MSLHALIAEMRERAALQPYNDMALLAIRWADKLEAALAGGGEAVAVIGECAEVQWLNGGPCQLPPGARLYTHPAGAVKVDEAMMSRAAWAYGEKTGHVDMSALRAALKAALNPGGSRE